QLRPSRDAVEDWRQYLTGRPERRRNSSRANQVDAGAIASLELLNTYLRELTGGRVCARLVTRAMTLINATRDEIATRRVGLKHVDFLRHPRLLMFPGETQADLSDDLVNTLAVSLDTFAMQLAASNPATEVSKAIGQPFVNAWRNFEQSRLAL